MTLDSRWKNPQGKTPEQLHDAIVQIVRELRKGDFLPDTPSAEDIAYDNATSGLAADNVQDAIDEVEGRVDDLEALPAAGLVLLNSGTVTNQATLDIVLTAFTAYRALRFVLDSFVPATDDVELWMRFSTDGGASFIATGYRYQVSSIDSGGNNNGANSASAAQILVSGGGAVATTAVSNTASEGGLHTEITLFRPSAAQRTRVAFKGAYQLSVDRLGSINGSGDLPTAQDTDAVRFLFEGGGNIASGNWALYGYA